MSTSITSSAPTLDLHWQWWDAQVETRDALRSGENDLVVLRTGYGGGKTLFGARMVIEFALEHPRSDNLVIAPDAQKGGPTTYKGFFKQLPGEDTVPDEGGDPENSPIVESYHTVKRRCTIINGAVIRLGSADVWNRYAGGEFNFIWCDEVAHYEHTDLYDLHEMLVTRQRTAEGPNVTLWTSTGNGFNQFYDITERKVEPADGGERPLPWADRMEVIVGSSLDNPFLHEKEKMLRSFEGTEREKQALHGGFAAPTGLVYSQFSRQHHVVEESEVAALVPDDAEPIYGYDAGWDHPRVLVELYPTHYSQWIATDCYYQTERPFSHLCDPSEREGWVYDEEKPRTTVYCEHEPEHIQQFSRAGFQAKQAHKNLDTGIDHVRGLLELDGDGRPGLLVSDRCTELIQEFFSYKEEHVGKNDAPDHCLDGTRYALHTHEQGGGEVRQVGSMRDLL